MGNLEMNSRSMGDSLELEATLSGANRAVVRGSLHPGSGALSLNASVQQLDLQMLQVFLKDYISRSFGTVSAELQINGTTSNAECRGMIYIDSTGLALTELNTLYRINQQQIEVEYPRRLSQR